MQIFAEHRVFALAALLGLIVAGAQAVTLSTSGVYDEGTYQSNGVDGDSGDPDQNITVAQFSNDVATAFANDLGGVAHFDDLGANGTTIVTDGNTFDITYGTSQSKTLTVTYTSVPLSGYKMTVQSDATGTTPISGDSDSQNGMGGSSPSFELSFSDPLLAFGITVLDRNRDLDLTLTLDDTSTVMISSDGLNEYFHGYKASAANPIVKATFESIDYNRYDDMGFIIPPPQAWYS